MRLHFLFIATFIITILFTGCATKQEQGAPPQQLSEAYLLKNITTLHLEKLNLTVLFPQSHTTNTSFDNSYATITSTIVALIPDNATSVLQDSTIQVRFELQASAWGNFKKALDKNGNSLNIKPTKSSIRSGNFIENFIIEISVNRLEEYADEDADFLLLSKDSELLVNIPAMYFGALYRYLL